jgi:hypothetical protein
MARRKIWALVLWVVIFGSALVTRRLERDLQAVRRLLGVRAASVPGLPRPDQASGFILQLLPFGRCTLGIAAAVAEALPRVGAGQRAGRRLKENTGTVVGTDRTEHALTGEVPLSSRTRSPSYSVSRSMSS